MSFSQYSELANWNGSLGKSQSRTLSRMAQSTRFREEESHVQVEGVEVAMEVSPGDSNGHSEKLASADASNTLEVVDEVRVLLLMVLHAVFLCTRCSLMKRLLLAMASLIAHYLLQMQCFSIFFPLVSSPISGFLVCLEADELVFPEEN